MVQGVQCFQEDPERQNRELRLDELQSKAFIYGLFMESQTSFCSHDDSLLLTAGPLSPVRPRGPGGPMGPG